MAQKPKSVVHNGVRYHRRFDGKYKSDGGNILDMIILMNIINGTHSDGYAEYDSSRDTSHHDAGHHSSHSSHSSDWGSGDSGGYSGGDSGGGGDGGGGGGD